MMIDDLKTQADACESVITLRRRLHEAADRIAELERENKRLRAGNDRHNDIVGEEVNARAITEAKCERLATMLRRFSLAAQTTGGTAGPDYGLQVAIGDTERVLRYTGMALAADQQGERTKDRPWIPTDRCHADSDGECSWVECPQLRDGEPRISGRHCPLDHRLYDAEDFDAAAADQQGEREDEGTRHDLPTPPRHTRRRDAAYPPHRRHRRHYT